LQVELREAWALNLRFSYVAREPVQLLTGRKAEDGGRRLETGGRADEDAASWAAQRGVPPPGHKVVLQRVFGRGKMWVAVCRALPGFWGLRFWFFDGVFC
jgi:hypothetical protein